MSAQDDIREAKAGKAKPKAARALAGETTIPFKDAVAPSSVNRQRTMEHRGKEEKRGEWPRLIR